MASLTPGLLSKLLQNAGNKDARVTRSEHRSPLLQVIEILPSLSASSDNPWHSRGFFLKLSDSLHSAYVSISDHQDLDLVDNLQLGQFVYVSRLDSGSPVPVLRGLKPVPGRRPCPCIGNPTDLVSSDLLPLPSTSTSRAAAAATEFRKDKLKLPKKVVGVLTGRDSGAEPQPPPERRRLSLDSSRKIWSDHTNAAAPLPLKSSYINLHSDKKALSKKDLSSKYKTLSTSPLKGKNEVPSPKMTTKPLKKEIKASIDSAAIPTCLLKVPLISEKCSEEKISWNVLPLAIHNLGKEVVCHRKAAVLAAASALEEASGAENVICCMQVFAELCNLSRQITPGALVEKYLDLHQNIEKAAMLVHSICETSMPEAKSTKSKTQCLLQDVNQASRNKHASFWVRAAIQTDLSKFSLFMRRQKIETSTSEKYHCVILENTPNKSTFESHQSPKSKPSPRIHNIGANSTAKRVPSTLVGHCASTRGTNPEREDRPVGNGLKETADLAEKLLLVSREWFLKYVDNLLSQNEGPWEGESSEVAHLLRQLKRVEHWLNNLVGKGVKVDETIKKLRKKLYSFLLEQVDSAMFNSK